jgi:hypothetical protein
MIWKLNDKRVIHNEIQTRSLDLGRNSEYTHGSITGLHHGDGENGNEK